MSEPREADTGAVQPDVVAPGPPDPAGVAPVEPSPAEVAKTYIVLQAYQEAIIDTLASLERECVEGDMAVVDFIALLRVRCVENNPTVELAYQVASEVL